MQEADWQSMYKISYNALVDALNSLNTFMTKQSELAQIISQDEKIILRKNNDSISAIQNFQDMVNKESSRLIGEIHQNNRAFISHIKQINELVNLNTISVKAIMDLIKVATLQTENLFIESGLDPEDPKDENIEPLKKPE